MVEGKHPPSDQILTKITPPSECNGCNKVFPSRNALFKHLKETDGECLSKDDYKDFVRYVRKSVKPPKVIILYGYLPSDGNGDSKRTVIRNGQDAGNIIMRQINLLQNEIDGLNDTCNDDNGATDEGGYRQSSAYKVNRSYGHFSRSAECVRQDMDTGAMTEVMAVRLFPLRGDISLDDWLDRVQRKLDAEFEQEERRSIFSKDKDCCPVTPIRILGRQDMPNLKFNAEMDVSIMSHDLSSEERFF